MIKKILHTIFSKMRVKRIIFFESVPDFSDNTKAVYDEFIKRGTNGRYKMIWLTDSDHPKNEKKRNLECINWKTRMGKLRYFYTLHTAKCLVSCNRFLVTSRKKQYSFYIHVSKDRIVSRESKRNNFLSRIIKFMGVNLCYTF